jgi:hypothetical protein
MRRQQVPQGSIPAGSRRRLALRYLAFAVAATVVAAVLRIANLGVPEQDSFYHFRYASLYAEKGLFMSAFPWLPYSAFSRFPSDIGYGFHVFLLPFTYLRSHVLAIHLASVAETVIMMIMLYGVLRRQRVAYPFAWPFVLLFSGPTVVWMLFQTRPQTLTMGLSALLLSALVAGGPLGAFLSALAIAFIHLNVIPIIPVVVGGVGIVKGIAERRWEWRTWAAALAGIVAGWALRPNPAGAAGLEWVQIAVHEAVRLQNVPIGFGDEWPPLPLGDCRLFIYLVALWIGVSAVFLTASAVSRHRASRRDLTFLWSSLVLSVVFFAGMVVVTQRTTLFWVTFAVMFIAKAFSCLLDPRAETEKPLLHKGSRAAISAVIVLLFAAMLRTWTAESVIRGNVPSINPFRMSAVSLWLRDHGSPGKIVYNVSWDMFPELFFWNPADRYVWGLDPIFLYDYDKTLYWKAHHLGTGEGTSRTWGTMGWPIGGGEDTYTVLRRDFKASAIVVDTDKGQSLYQYLASDSRYVLAIESEGYAVFTLAP